MPDGGLRSFPNIPQPEVLSSYAVMLARGFDTVIETFNIAFPDSLGDQLEMARVAADELDDRQGQARGLVFGGEEFQISPIRGKGVRWWISNDDLTIIFRPLTTEWCVTVRYSAAGLWEHGLDRLRARAIAALLKEGHARGDDWQRLSSVHWALDVYSPAFTEEMKPRLIEQLICHSSCKKRLDAKIEVGAWGRADYLETLTVGKINSVQVQVYDKGKEITEASGKTWMIKLWEREGFYPPEDGPVRHVWRVEIRFGKEFLKGRNVNRLDRFIEAMRELVGEVLMTRRLCSPTADSNRSRWPMHPLWALAFDAAGRPEGMMPLGRQITGAASVLRDQLLRQAAGTVRAAAVLIDGDFDEGTFARFSGELEKIVSGDGDHERKVEKLTERYRYVNDAR